MPDDEQTDGGASEPPPFFTVRMRHTGGAIYTEIVLFLGEAALAGVVGGGIYDGLRASLRRVVERWRARDDPALSAAEIEALAHVAVRLKLKLREDARLVTQEVSTVDGEHWLCLVTGPDGETYRVRVGADLDAARAHVLITG